jgi:hypothetical protein
MFDIKLEGIDKALKQFDPKIVIRAANAAINDVSKQGVNEAERIIKSEYNIKPSRLKQFLKLTSRAKGNSLEATITGKGLGLALSYFDVKQIGRSIRSLKIGGQKFKSVVAKRGQQYGGAVTALVKRSAGRKVVSGRYDNKPFIAQMKTGHIGVWVRKDKDRKPIEQLYGPGVGGLFGTLNVMERTKKIINEKFAPRFSYWLNRYKGDAR